MFLFSDLFCCVVCFFFFPAFFFLSFFSDILNVFVSQYDLRSLVLNLCDFQYRFSIPMALPFGLGKDFPAKLDTPRPFGLLKSLNLIVPVTAAPSDPEKHDSIVGPDGTVYVLEGSDLWCQTTGRSEPPQELNLSAFRWLKDLFVVLEGERENPDARRLGACWYYTASEANFDEESEGELQSGEEEEAGRAVTGTLLGIFGGPEAEEYNEDDDEDFVPAASASVSESFESDAEAQQMEESPEFKMPEAPFRRQLAPPSDGEDQDGDYKDDGGDDDDDDDVDDEEDGGANKEEEEEDSEKLRELQKIEEDIRKSVLQSVQRLHCYMPSPNSHMKWFKRMLIKMQVKCSVLFCFCSFVFWFLKIPFKPGAVDEEWFPWGVPPVQHVLDTTIKLESQDKMSKEDDEASDFLREVLDPFAKMQQAQQQSPGPIESN